MAGISTVETKLMVKKAGGAEFTEIEFLMEVPELGGDPEKIDVTTLSDKVKKSIPGVRDLGDLAFKFLYDNSSEASNYRMLKSLQDGEELASYQIVYPDGTAHEFDALVNVKMDSVAVNAALTFTASMSLQTDISTTNPQ